MASLRCGGMRKAALIAFALGALSLSLILVATQPSHLSPDSGPPASYTGVRPDWVRVLPPLSGSPPATIQPAPATPTEPPLATPSPVEPPPTVEAPAPSETIAIAGISPPAEAPPSATAAALPTASPAPPTASPTSLTASPTLAPTPAATEGPDPAFAQAILELTNQARLANGLPPLAEHPALVAAAEGYADLHAHLSPDRLDHRLNGSTLDSRAEAEGYVGWTFLAENLVWSGFDPPLSPAETVQQWLASPAHRDNMLNPTVNETGVGCYVSAAERPFRICVQDFGARP